MYKQITFSATDAMYDLLYNPEFSITNAGTDAREFPEHFDACGRLDYEGMKTLTTEMLPDLRLLSTPSGLGLTRREDMLTEVIHFAKAVIKAWGHDMYHIIQYFHGGFFDIGRLHPNSVATNGVKQSYLFLHERHPKHKMNEVLNLTLVPCIIEDAFHLQIQDEYLSKDAEGDLRKAGRLKSKTFTLPDKATRLAKKMKDEGKL